MVKYCVINKIVWYINIGNTLNMLSPHKIFTFKSHFQMEWFRLQCAEASSTYSYLYSDYSKRIIDRYTYSFTYAIEYNVNFMPPL